MQTRTTVDAAADRIRERLAAAGRTPRRFTTGPAAIGRDLIAASANSLESTTLATIVLVVFILLLVLSLAADGPDSPGDHRRLRGWP